MTKRAIVYARVSTDDQARDGFSLAAQIEAGRKYADLHGFTVAHELIDDGVSGALAFSERPASATAWALLRQGKADAIIAQNVDRLSRDIVDLLVTIRELLRAGVEVHCLDLGRVTSEYDIMLVIRGWQGSDERDKIKRRSMRGKREKMAQGMVVGTRKPYGYDHLRDERRRVVNFTVNEEQAAVVRLIFDWYTHGDGESGPLSQREIARRLSDAGIVTAHAEWRTRAAWTPNSVSRILLNTTYKGEWRYTAQATDDAPEQTFTIAIPAIIDAATWELAQVQRERNARKAKRNGKRSYLLTGIIKCGCGYSMHGHTKENGAQVYYECGTTGHFRRDERPCQERAIRAESLEAAAWDAILNVVKKPEELKEKLLQAQQAELEEQEPRRAELAAVEALLAEAEAEASQLATAITKATGVVGQVLQDKMTALDERYQALTARKDELETALADRRLTDETIDALLQFAADVAVGIDHADHALKRQALDAFDARVIVQDGKATLHYRLPVPTSIELHLRLQTQPNYIELSIPLDLSAYSTTDRPPRKRAASRPRQANHAPQSILRGA